MKWIESRKLVKEDDGGSKAGKDNEETTSKNGDSSTIISTTSFPSVSPSLLESSVQPSFTPTDIIPLEKDDGKDEAEQDKNTTIHDGSMVVINDEVPNTVELSTLHEVLSTPFELILSPFSSTLDISLAADIISIYNRAIVETLFNQEWAKHFYETGEGEVDLTIRLTNNLLRQRVVDTIIANNVPSNIHSHDNVILEQSTNIDDPFLRQRTRTRRQRRKLDHFPRHKQQLLLAVEQTAYIKMISSNVTTTTTISGTSTSTTWNCTDAKLSLMKQRSFDETECDYMKPPTSHDLDSAILSSIGQGREINIAVSGGGEGEEDYPFGSSSSYNLTYFHFSKFLNTSINKEQGGGGMSSSSGLDGTSTGEYNPGSPNWLLLGLIFGCGILVLALFIHSLAVCTCIRRRRRRFSRNQRYPRQTYGDAVNDDDPDYCIPHHDAAEQLQRQHVKDAMIIMEQYNRELAKYKQQLEYINNNNNNHRGLDGESETEVSPQQAMELNEQYDRVNKLYRNAKFMWGRVNKTYLSQVVQLDPESERNIELLMLSSSKQSKNSSISTTTTTSPFDGRSYAASATTTASTNHMQQTEIRHQHDHHQHHHQRNRSVHSPSKDGTKSNGTTSITNTTKRGELA